jgi:hypothetical protein
MAGDPVFANLWIIVLIVADLVVCGLILIYLFQNRNQKGTPVDIEGLKDLVDSLSSLIKDSDRASRDLLDSLNESHQRTVQLLGEMDAKEEKLTKAARQTEELLSKRHIPEVLDKYTEVSRLADLGMKAEDIARRVKLPKGEIELVLGLRR